MGRRPTGQPPAEHGGRHRPQSPPAHESSRLLVKLQEPPTRTFLRHLRRMGWPRLGNQNRRERRRRRRNPSGRGRNSSRLNGDVAVLTCFLRPASPGAGRRAHDGSGDASGYACWSWRSSSSSGWSCPSSRIPRSQTHRDGDRTVTIAAELTLGVSGAYRARECRGTGLSRYPL